MQSSNSLTFENYTFACAVGALRAGIMTFALYPFELCKIELQRHENPPRIPQILSTLYKNGGLYAGLSPRMAQVLSKQFYSIPVLVYFPDYLDRYSLPSWQKQAAAGILNGTLDAVGAGPANWFMFGLILKEKRERSLKELFAPRRFSYSLLASCVQWSVFSISLHHYNSLEEQSPIPLDRQFVIGAKTSCWQTIVATPLNFLNTILYAEKLTLPKLREKMCTEFSVLRYFRGITIIQGTSLLQNITSVLAYNYICQSNSTKR